jgi:hypothetical protein
MSIGQHLVAAALGALTLLPLAGCCGDISVALPIGGGGAGTPSDPNIYIFDPGLTSFGNITGGVGTRAALDAFVQGGTVPGVCSGKTVRAFISYNGADYIANMPANFGIPTNAPIFGALGPLLANDWADLIDGSVLTTMGSATGVSNYYWTACGNNTGTYSGSNCVNWTSSTSVTALGLGGPDDPTRILFDVGSNCTSSWAVLGICY